MNKFITGVIIGGIASYIVHRASVNMLKLSKAANEQRTAKSAQ